MSAGGRSGGDEGWRKGLVGREIEVRFGELYYNARIQSYRTGLFSVTYFSDGSVEQCRLFPDFTGTDPSGEDRIEWRFREVEESPVDIVMPDVSDEDDGNEEEERPQVVVKQKFSSSSSPQKTTVVVEDEEGTLTERRPATKKRSPKVKREKIEPEEEEDDVLIETLVEFKDDNEEEWIEALVDGKDTFSKVPTYSLYLTKTGTLERVELRRGDHTGVRLATQRRVEWREARKPTASAAIKKRARAALQEWRESVVNRVISVPFDDEWLEANVEEDLRRDDLFLIRYLDGDMSYEQVRLFPDYSGSDPAGEEPFGWKLVEDRVAGVDEDMLPNFPHSLVGRTLRVEFDKAWFKARVEGVTRQKVVTLRYMVDGTVERVKLKEEFSGSDLSGKETFRWKF